MLIDTGDDAAVVLPPAGEALVLTQDALVEGIDFRRGWLGPAALGRRALAVAVSDIAGMGATPLWCTATLCARGMTRAADVLALHAGLTEAADAIGARLVGGDLSDTTGPLVVDVVAVGSVAPDALLRRDAGRPGDLVVVTGRLGRAAAGLRLRLEADDSGSPMPPWGDAPGPGAAAVRPDRDGADRPGISGAAAARLWDSAFLQPAPRLAEGRALVRAGVRCGGDLSDGLLVDLRRTVRASGCGAELWADRLPVDPALRGRMGDAWPGLALAGGEDFELVATVAPARLAGLVAEWPQGLAPLSVVGRLVPGGDVRLLTSAGGDPLALPAPRSRHWG